MVISLPAKNGPVESASLMKVRRVLRNSDLADSRLYGFSGVCWRKRWKAAVALLAYEGAECGWCRVEDDSATACWFLCVWQSLCMTHFTTVELCYVEVYTCRSLDATMISRALNDSSFRSIRCVRNTMLKGTPTNDAACHIVDGDLQLCLCEGVMAWVLFNVSTCASAFQNACLSRLSAFKHVFMSCVFWSISDAGCGLTPSDQRPGRLERDMLRGLELPKTYQRDGVRKCLVEVLADQC